LLIDLVDPVRLQVAGEFFGEALVTPTPDTTSKKRTAATRIRTDMILLDLFTFFVRE